ncbi:hypothetical protein [Salicibibacter kimchii]|uniref:Uncharacterized protein n=1 Tax=Salicibibacter kimchii TaxID=2099786 RepID=A0A345BWA4_9BACI|nr:hypothetical protein [Salicibibacter kimchii]AXF55235.1 hypothetical protein DT065_03835 [Salicibibacter kimchii]
MTTFNNFTKLKEKVDKHRPLSPEKMEMLDEKFEIDWTFHSNAIEGNTMSIRETTLFLQEDLTSKGNVERIFGDPKPRGSD